MVYVTAQGLPSGSASSAAGSADAPAVHTIWHGPSLSLSQNLANRERSFHIHQIAPLPAPAPPATTYSAMASSTLFGLLLVALLVTAGGADASSGGDPASTRHLTWLSSRARQDIASSERSAGRRPAGIRFPARLVVPDESTSCTLRTRLCTLIQSSTH